MRKKQINQTLVKRIIAIALAVILVCSAGASSLCFAETDTMADTSDSSLSTHSIEAKRVIDGDSFKGDTKATFVLTAENENTPMPEGKTGGSKEVSITGKDALVDFGVIAYNTPDVYNYTVSRKPQDEIKGYTVDKTTYSVTTVAYADGNVKEIIEYEKGKPESMVYKDVYTIKDKPVNNPKTGVSESVKNILALTSIIVIMIAGLVSLFRRKNRNSSIF